MNAGSQPSAHQNPKLLDRVRAAVRSRQYSMGTLKCFGQAWRHVALAMLRRSFPAARRRLAVGASGPPSGAITRYGLVRAFRMQVGTVAAPNPKRTFNGSSLDGI